MNLQGRSDLDAIEKEFSVLGPSDPLRRAIEDSQVLMKTQSLS